MILIFYRVSISLSILLVPFIEIRHWLLKGTVMNKIDILYGAYRKVGKYYMKISKDIDKLLKGNCFS